MRKMIGLEALERIRDFRYGKDKLLVCQTEMYDIIENELKALEIINNKRIDVDWFKECNSYTAYNKSRLIYSKITQEEYELVNKALNKKEKNEKVNEED